MSPYSVNMGEDKKCEFVCQYKVTQADMHKYELLSDKHFEYRLSLDDLPSATLEHSADDSIEKIKYADSIPIARVNETGKIVVYNHLNLIVETHKTS